MIDRKKGLELLNEKASKSLEDFGTYGRGTVYDVVWCLQSSRKLC